MKKAFVVITTVTLMIGVIGTALSLLFGANTVSYIQTINVNGVTFKTYDFKSYVEQLNYQFNDLSRLELYLPPLSSEDDILTWLKNLLLVVIFATNIFLYPLRIGSYIVGIVLALIGINMQATDNPLHWLVVLFQTITELQIPYPS